MTTPVLRGSTAPLPGRPDGTPFGQNTLQATSPDATLVGDLILAVTWQGTPSASSSSLTLRSGEGWTQLFNFLHDDGTNDGSFAAAWKIATLAGAQVYQAFDSSSQTTDCRTALRVYQVGTFDTSSMPTATPVSFTDGAVAPDPGNISGLVAIRDYMIEAIGGWWCNSGSINCIPGAPSGYGNLISTVDPGWLELAIANKAVTGVTSENPGVFTDNLDATTNRGSVGGAIAILGHPGTLRRAVVTQAELEVPEPTSERRAVITQAELEVPNKKFPETLTYIFNRSWNRYKFQSLDPQPVGARRAIITQAELEVPDLTRRAIISHAELEVPTSSPGGLAVGAYTAGTPETNNVAHENWLGRTMDLHMTYLANHDAINGSWSWLANPFSTNVDLDNYGTWLASHPNRRFELSLGMCPWFGAKGVDPGRVLPEVAAGTHNSKFAAFASAMAGANIFRNDKIVYVRIGWEFDWTGYAWQVKLGSTNPYISSYAPAFRQIADTLRNTLPDVQFKFVWCPTHEMWRRYATSQSYINTTYPGNGHVDLIDMDIYDMWTGFYPPTNTTTWTNAWNGKHAVALGNMNTFALSKNKGQSISEWGCIKLTNDPNQVSGIDNPIFVENMLTWALDHDFEFLLYFDKNTSGASIKVSPTTIFPNASAKYKELFSLVPHPY